MDSINKIEQAINDIENYIGTCRNRAFSTTDIIVNREEMEDLLHDLRRKTPEEVTHFKKVIANKEAILADATARADAMLADAERKAKSLLNQAAEEHNQMISEHEVMLRAQARADEYVNMAISKAQDIIDNATIEANALKDAANQYMVDVLEHLERIISSATQSANANYEKSMQSARDSFSKLINSLGEYENIIQDNLRQLQPAEEEEAVPASASATEEESNAEE